MKRERRFIDQGTAELRLAGDGRQRIVGMAVPYDSTSRDLGGFVERFAPGAFGDLSGADVVALFNHDSSAVLGRTPKTLRLDDTATGLRYAIDPPDTSTARDLVELLKRGDVRGSSFGFGVPPGGDTWAELGDGTMLRTVTEARLYDVSPVTFPAYPQTDVSVAQRQLEQLQESRALPGRLRVLDYYLRRQVVLEDDLAGSTGVRTLVDTVATIRDDGFHGFPEELID